MKKHQKFTPGDLVQLISGGPQMVVISDAEWHAACLEEPRTGFVPCVFWNGSEDYYKDFPRSALEGVFMQAES